MAETESGLTAFDIETGATAWTREADEPFNTLAAEGQLYFLEGSRQTDGRWQHRLVALALESGDELWAVPVESEYGRRSPVLRIHFAGAGVICLLEQTSVRFLAAADGSELWQHEGDVSAPRGDTRGVGHFLRGNQVWLRHGASDWLICDPQTGEVIETKDSMGAGRMKCQPALATERFVLNPRTSSLWNMEDGSAHSYDFVRGGCTTGIIPANGLGYVTPNACGCVSQQVRGFAAIVTNPELATADSRPGDLQKGPSYNRDYSDWNLSDANSWPVYRGQPERGARSGSSLPDQPAPQWRTAIDLVASDTDDEWRLMLNPPLTAPTVAGDLVMVARPQTHQVIALDRDNGQIRWTYTAGGRVTTPPTLYDGLVLFGAHDGFVYALDARDGELAWRRRAAPADRRIMAFGQVESAWPVTGGVLVRNGVGVVAAGRSSTSDGGTLVHAFEPRTGEILWTRLVDSAHHGNSDLLVAMGEDLYLMDQQIDLNTGESDRLPFSRDLSERAGTELGFPEGVRYLRSGKAGFSENAWTRLSVALRKALSTWALGNVEGELIAFDDDRVTAYQIDAATHASGDTMWSAPVTRGGGAIVSWTGEETEPDWNFEMEEPAQVEALLTNQNRIFVAGPKARHEPMGAGFLKVLNAADGAVVHEMELDIAPVHDGLAAADGRLIAVLRDGTIVSFQ